MSQHLPKIGQNRGKHLFEILSQIKDNIMKKRYNLAWEMASKHYEQNKNSLTNEEIYHLCQQSTTAIERKVNHRLTGKNKRAVATVTNGHIQHVLSLEMSLHGIILPEVVSLDPKYFNMLENETESLNPKSIAQEEMVFQRKNNSNFLNADSLHKTLKRIVKQHLKICNSVLMFKITKRKNTQEVIEHLDQVQAIFDHFKEHQFPSQIMDFELIKLSLIEDLNLKEGVQSHYRLPLGFLTKIYRHLKKGKEDVLDHYLKKLNAYLVLSFRHLNVSIQDVFIGCCEAKYIAKIVQSMSAPSSKHIQLGRRPLLTKSMKRLFTIENQSEQETTFKQSKKRTEFTDTEKKIESKTKVNSRTEMKLMDSAECGLKVIEKHLRGRKELIEIILKYFVHGEIDDKKRNLSKQDYIDNPVVLNDKMKNRKKGQNETEEEGGYKSLNLFKSKQNGLAAMLTRSKNRNKTIFDNEDREPELIKMPLKKQSQGKFITKNIQQLKKPVQLKPTYFQEVDALLSNLQKMQDKFTFFECSPTAEDEPLFEKERKRKIEEFKMKLVPKSQQFHKIDVSLQDQTEQFPELSSTDLIDHTKIKTISLLDEIVTNQINNLMLQEGGHKENLQPSNKIELLKASVSNLTTERKLLVETLTLRHNQSSEFMEENNASYSRYMQNVESKEKEQIDVIVDSFRTRIDQHCKTTKKLMKLEKQKDSFLPKKTGKLKLDGPKKKEKRLSQMNFEGIQQGYRKLEGRLQEEGESETSLKSQFDKLRRDVAKNQFMAQNEKRNKIQKKCPYPTIIQATKQEETLLI